jgi:pimeloyl-ACP methyl ester carboxylesterase
MNTMRSFHLPAAILAAILTAITAQAACAAGEDANQHPVKVVAEARLRVTTAAGSGALPIYISRDLSAPQPGVTRAVLVFHGRSRNADDYFRSAQKALAAAVQAGAPADATLLVAPQFLAEADVTSHHLADDTLRWTWTGWEGGDAARGPAAISSFEAIDAILARLADRKLFPALKSVIIAGHSGGGQVVQRYAVVGRGEAALKAAGLSVRYVVANPSSYLYFSADRPLAGGGFAPPAGTMCANFNQWKYGWEGAPPYAQSALPAVLEHGYALRDVIYLLGTADVNPNHPALDKSCAGELQGAYRLVRGLNYVGYLRRRDTDTVHRLWEVEGVGHDGDRMLTSSCGLAALFDLGTCAGK